MSKSGFVSKKLQDQTIVITGASAGIGLACAQLAAKKGAKVVLSSRNGAELDKALAGILKDGGNAISVLADVTSIQDLQKLRNKSMAAFGAIDTWINAASISLEGYLLQTDIDAEKKVFEINYWGTRNGSAEATEAMKERGGVLINLGAEVSVTAQPLLGAYSASKQAIKTMTEALRTELRDLDFPIEVCLVRPNSSITPLYPPEVVAEAIIKSAEHPQRDVYVGGPARLSAILETFFPAVKDMVAETRMKDLKRDDNETSFGSVLNSLTHSARESLKNFRKAG